MMPGQQILRQQRATWKVKTCPQADKRAVAWCDSAKFIHSHNRIWFALRGKMIAKIDGLSNFKLMI